MMVFVQGTGDIPSFRRVWVLPGGMKRKNQVTDNDTTNNQGKAADFWKPCTENGKLRCMKAPGGCALCPFSAANELGCERRNLFAKPVCLLTERAFEEANSRHE